MISERDHVFGAQFKNIFTYKSLAGQCSSLWEITPPLMNMPLSNVRTVFRNPIELLFLCSVIFILESQAISQKSVCADGMNQKGAPP